MDLSCEFCKIIAAKSSARIVFETPDTLSFFPLHPATPGHTLVIPKIHASDIWTISQGSFLSVMKVAQTVAVALREVLKPEGLNLINSAGAAATQTIFHFHVHLVPRWKSDTIGDIWPRGEFVSTEVKDRLEDLVREACADTHP